MKKKIISLIMILAMLMTFMSTISVQASAISAEEMKQKFDELRAMYPSGSYWNSTYMGASQCIGFAFLVDDYLFNECARDWYVHGNINNLCVGDHIRYRSTYWDHSLVVTNISGNTVYFVDCNGFGGSNTVYWGQTTKAQVSEWIARYPLYDGNTRRGGYGYIQTQADNWVQTLDNIVPTPTYQPIHRDTNPHVSNGVYTFKNAESGRMMNVYAGSDYNGNAVTIWEHDGTTDQKFRVEHNGNGQYFVYAQCSGSGRVLDILREGGTENGALKHGCVVDIYNKGDNAAQLFYIYPVGDGKYVFELGSANSRVIAATDAGASHTDGSQLILKDYTGAAFEQWYLCDENGNRIDRILTGISIKSLPTKITYYTGESLSTDGLTLLAQYNDGSTKEISSGYDISYDFSSVGTKTVTVKYENKIATFNVSVIESPFEITNLQSQNSGKNKVVTADVNKSNIICYLAAYADGRLVECDIQKATSRGIELCVSSAYDKYVLMVWDENMKPLMNARVIY